MDAIKESQIKLIEQEIAAIDNNIADRAVYVTTLMDTKEEAEKAISRERTEIRELKNKRFLKYGEIERIKTEETP